MSVEKHYYIIAGYDLTGCTTAMYKDWQWSTEGEDYRYNHSKGKVQLFDDPMSGYYLYFGYVFGAGDQYELDTVSFDVDKVRSTQDIVESELNKLIDLGIISKDCKPKYQIIAFEECA